MNGKLHWPSEEKNWLSKDYTKERQTWRSTIETREILILLLMRSIRSSSHNDHSHNKRINGLVRLKETKISLYGKLEMRNRLFRENQATNCREIEELRRISCEETDRARQARIDELSLHQDRNPTTASHLLIQIQDLQNKLNSLSDARESFDPEPASSSGATHVRSKPSTFPSPRMMLCRDSGLPHDTRNIVGTQGNVFEREGHPLLKN